MAQHGFHCPALLFLVGIGATTALGCATDDNASLAALRGQIVDTAGAPIAQVSVHAYAARVLGDTLGLFVGSARSGTTGQYETILSAFLIAPFEGHLRLDVMPPDSTGYRDTVLAGIPIRFAESVEDTALVQIVLSD